MAEEAVKVGDVAAPSWVLPVGVVVVTVGSILSGFLLKPGEPLADSRVGQIALLAVQW